MSARQTVPSRDSREGIDALTESVASAATSLGGKEHELAALHRHFTESSSRIETVVEDIREALSALPA